MSTYPKIDTGVKRKAGLDYKTGRGYHRAVLSPLRTLLTAPPSPDPVAKVGIGGWLLCAVVFLAAALALSSVQFSKPNLVGADAYYHVRVAQIIAEEGIPDEFPYTQASVFKEHYADKQFLFHVLLIPFLGEDLILGPKILTVLLTALLFALMAWVLLRNGVPLPWLWTFLMLASGVMFLFRMSLTRPHLLAVPLSVLAAHLMLRRHVLGTFLVSMLFPLCYTAAHLLPGMALVYAAACVLRKEPFPWRLILAAFAGVLLGLLLHPHRFNIFSLWYLQNVQVLLNVWRIPDEVGMGNEFFSVPGRIILIDAFIPLLGAFAVAFFFLLRGTRASLRTVFLFLLSTAFFVLFLNIGRFVEYWVPFTILLLASGARDLTEGTNWREWLRRHRIGGPALCGLLTLLLLAQTARSVVESQLEVETDRSLYYRYEATWISKHVPAGEVVFTCNWDSFPYLFFFAPKQRYLVALDPTFMQAYDPDLFRVWYRIATGQPDDSADLVLSRFNSRWVFAEKREWILPCIERARRDPRFLLVCNGPDAAIFAVMPDPLPVARAVLFSLMARELGA